MGMLEGIVVKREAQNIEVLLEDKVLRGIPRGKIRTSEKIFAGDKVTGYVGEGNVFIIEDIKARKNLLVRPPVANVDCVVIVETIKEPEFNSFVLDNLLVVYEREGVDIYIVFNKVDLLSGDEKHILIKWLDVYKRADYRVLTASIVTGEGLEEFSNIFEAGIYVFAGPSGTGKSSLISAISGVDLKRGEVSKKTGRGKHTTTGVSLLKLKGNTFIADTPGFSRVDASRFVDRKRIKDYFREFSVYNCKFKDCLHLREEGCAVKDAVDKGKIPRERYENYVRIVS